MSIKISWPWELPDIIDGIAVVCDTWGATTNINTILNNNVGKLFIVNKKNVLNAKKEYQDALIIGESDEFAKDFFHSSNLTSHVAKTNVKDKTVLFMTNNGSRVIELAFSKKAHKIITVSYSNIQSVYDFLKGGNEKIYLIPSGDKDAKDWKAQEDLLCVEALKNLLEEKHVDFEKIHAIARQYIHDIYGYQKFNEEEAFPVVFDILDLPIVPICAHEDGYIRITNLFTT